MVIRRIEALEELGLVGGKLLVRDHRLRVVRITGMEFVLGSVGVGVMASDGIPGNEK